MERQHITVTATSSGTSAASCAPCRVDLPRDEQKAAMLSALSLPSSWTKDNFPECAPAPSCYPNRRAPDHGSPLNALFNKWCSDKGTYWLSKHNYGAAYDSVLGPRRAHTTQMLELGVGDETAGSLNAWREYFPRAQLWVADLDVERFRNKAQFAWASRQKRRHGCFDDADAWRDPRVHALFGVDSSNFTALRALPLPPVLDLIIDDAAHVLAHQITSLEVRARGRARARARVRYRVLTCSPTRSPR